MTTRNRSRSLVAELSDELRRRISDGEFLSGDRLPSEISLIESHGLSRSVVRQAIAALRADGIVEARQGAGVFVRPVEGNPQSLLQDIDHSRISSVIEMLEIRIAVETEAAALAALRHSALQEEHIITCHHAHLECIQSGEPTGEADFALHLAIAKAANSPKFEYFMKLIGPALVPRLIRTQRSEAGATEYLTQLHQEHGRIVDAISVGDEDGARAAMRAHLKGSQARYRMLMREQAAEVFSL